MKKFSFLTILISIVSIDLWGQTPQEITRQQTYWNYRNRLKQDFNKIGYDRGNSLTASRHQFADYDGNYPYTCIGNQTGGLIQWGDALVHHGTYLAMRASEYKLLNNYKIHNYSKNLLIPRQSEEQIDYSDSLLKKHW